MSVDEAGKNIANVLVQLLDFPLKNLSQNSDLHFDSRWLNLVLHVVLQIINANILTSFWEYLTFLRFILVNHF